MNLLKRNVFIIKPEDFSASDGLSYVKEVETRNKDEPCESIYRDFATEVYKLEDGEKKYN